MNTTSRNFVFTCFDKDELSFAIANHQPDIIKYICYGIETCPTTGRIHYQGYLELKKSIRITGVRKLFGPHCKTHFEYRKGTADEAINYCRKDGQFSEFGDRAKQGERTDIMKLKDKLDTPNISLKQVADEHFTEFLKYTKGIMTYRTISTTSRDWPVNLEIHIGPTNCGKSHYAKTTYPNAYWMIKPNGSSVYFDGYDGQDTIVLDEFYGWLPWDLLLRLCDKYPLKLNVKGGTVECLVKNVIITSNSHILKWYPNIKDLDPLIRRITLLKDDYITRTEFMDMAKFNDMKNRIMAKQNEEQVF